MPTDAPKLALKFLRTVWRLQGVGTGYGFVAQKSTDGQWSDDPVRVRPRTAPVSPIIDPGHGDYYFTPCIFAASKRKGSIRGPRRTNGSALPSRWLYADLDEVNPNGLALEPTVAIETSPGRYQAMWLLDAPLAQDVFARLNQRLTYATGADKGGWHASKVLRVPGTVNHKYKGEPRVKLLWFNRKMYTKRTVLKYIRSVADEEPAASSPVSADLPDLPNTTAAHLRKRYRGKLKRRARKLLTVRRVLPSEDRSARMWELENLCLDAGMSPEQTLIVVRSCAYNKYAGQRREVRVLWTEIQKAVAARHRAAGRESTHAPEPRSRNGASNTKGAASHTVAAEHDDEPAEDDTADEQAPLDLAPMRLARYLAKDVRAPSWLVQHIWGRAAHGIWAGDFKTYKSTLLMDLAVSVASGRPFLGKFDVHRTGPVLYVQEENSHGFMHDRLHRIVQAKGLGNIVHERNGKRGPTIEFGHDLDLHLLNLSGFDLTKTSHTAALDSWAAMHEPALIILDPLYRLAPGIDENSQHEMAPILNALADVSNGTDAALVLAHHYNKPTQGNAQQRSGHRISGTSVFSRWWESSVYAERSGEAEAYSIKFHNEHREHGSAAPQVVTVEMSAGDPDMYAIHLADVANEDDTAHDDDDRDSGLSLDQRTERIAVMTVRSRLGLKHSRDAQKLLKGKGYRLKKAPNNGKLYAYPPSR